MAIDTYICTYIIEDIRTDGVVNDSFYYLLLTIGTTIF